MRVTTITCDRCKTKVGGSHLISTVRIESRGEYTPRRELELCAECMVKVGFFRSEKVDSDPPPKPTAVDILHALVELLEEME